VKENTEIEL